MLTRRQIALLAILSTFSLISFAAQQSPTTSQQPPDAPAPQPGSSARPNPDGNGIYHTGNGVKAPTLISSVQPDFSEEARKRKVSARVTVEFVIDSDGTSRDFRVTKSEGWPHENKKDLSAIHSLESKAVACVKQYHFNPATLDGKPVPYQMNIEVNFQMF